MKVALDTNILAYAEGVNDRTKRDAALEVFGKLPRDTIIIPVQALGELFNVLVRKVGISRKDARERLLGWSDAFPLADTSSEVMFAAATLAADHGLGIWDATMMSAATHAGCRLLFSEDFQQGFTWRGITAVNPFSSRRHALLSALLGKE